MWVNGDSHWWEMGNTLLVRMKNIMTTLEENMAVSHKTKHTITKWCSNHALWYLPKRVDTLHLHKKKLYIDVLWPNSTNLIGENVLNNNSIVCKLQYKNFSMIFTGDIEKEAEKQILHEYKDNLEILKATIFLQTLYLKI